MGLKIPKEKLTEALDKALAGLRSNIQSAVDKAATDVREKIQTAMDKTASNAIQSTLELQTVQKDLRNARKAVDAIEKPIKPLETLVKTVRGGVVKPLNQLLKVFKLLSWIYNMFPIQYVYGVLVDETKEQLSDQIENLDYNLSLGEKQIDYAKNQIRKLQSLLDSVTLNITTKEVVANLPEDSDDIKKLQKIGIIEKPDKAGNSNRYGGKNIFEKLAEKQADTGNSVVIIQSDSLEDTLISLGFSGNLQTELQSTYVQNQLFLSKPGSTVKLRCDLAGSSLLDFYAVSDTIPPRLTVSNLTYQARKGAEEGLVWYTGIKNLDMSKKYWKTTAVLDGQGQYSRTVVDVLPVQDEDIRNIPESQNIPESRTVLLNVLSQKDLLEGKDGVLAIRNREDIAALVDSLFKLILNSNLSDATKGKLMNGFVGNTGENDQNTDAKKIITGEKRTYRIPGTDTVLTLTMHKDPDGSNSVATKHFTRATHPNGDKVAESSKSYTLDPDILFTELELILDKLYT